MDFEKDLSSIGPAVLNFINSLLQKKWDREDERLANLIDAVDQLKKITENHKKLIDDVVSPALNKNDLATTADRYNKLAMEGNIPTGYGQAAGTLANAQEQYFKKGPINEAIEDIRRGLRGFRYAAYLLEDYDPYEPAPLPTCYNLSTALSIAPSWAALGSNPIPESQSGSLEMFGEELTKVIDLIHYRQNLQRIPQPQLRTGNDVTELVKKWCREWQILVNRTLTEGRGLYYGIGRLQLQRRGHSS